jgi:hypothetical protein
MRVIFTGDKRKSSQQFCWIILLAFLLTIPTALFGQAYFGTVTGVLTDPSGAVIPGVKLTLTDQEQGLHIQRHLRRRGPLSLPSIPPGTYSVTAEIPGFEKTVRTGIHVDINRTRRPICK